VADGRDVGRSPDPLGDDDAGDCWVSCRPRLAQVFAAVGGAVDAIAPGDGIAGVGLAGCLQTISGLDGAMATSPRATVDWSSNWGAGGAGVDGLPQSAGGAGDIHRGGRPSTAAMAVIRPLMFAGDVAGGERSQVRRRHGWPDIGPRGRASKQTRMAAWCSRSRASGGLPAPLAGCSAEFDDEGAAIL